MPANDIQIGGDHYLKYGEYQPFEVYKRWLGPEGYKAWLKGNIISYLVRQEDKGGLTDLRKAYHDLGEFIEFVASLEKETNETPTAKRKTRNRPATKK